MNTLLITIAIPVIFLIIFTVAARSMRKGSDGMSNVMLGATDNLLTQDKKRAVEIVVRQESDARLEHEGSETDEL